MTYDGFENWEDVKVQFNATISENVIPLLAIYDIDGYEGSAFVVYVDGSDLNIVNGSYCSCHGLEDQFDPEVVKWEIAEEYVEKTWPYGINKSHKEYLLSIIRDVIRSPTNVKETVCEMVVMYRLSN